MSARYSKCVWLRGLEDGECVRGGDIRRWEVCAVDGGWGVYGHAYAGVLGAEECGVVSVGRLFGSYAEAEAWLGMLLEEMCKCEVVDVSVVGGDLGKENPYA